LLRTSSGALSLSSLLSLNNALLISSSLTLSRALDATGRISLSQWSEAMESVTNYKLPWRLLREKLAVMNENNEILYENTLQLIEIDDDIVSCVVAARLIHK
jgi:hypothetical protein